LTTKRPFLSVISSFKEIIDQNTFCVDKCHAASSQLYYP
jgi:hypothetical protein